MIGFTLPVFIFYVTFIVVLRLIMWWFERKEDLTPLFRWLIKMEDENRCYSNA